MKLPDYAFKGLEPLRPTDIIPKGTAMFTTEDLSDFIDRGNDLLLTGNRPTDLQSLRETRGSTQSRSERWGRGLKKAGANAGGIIAESGVVLFNLLKAAVTKSPGASPVLTAQGSDFSFFEEVINSQAQKDIDEWSEGVRQKNPHYLTQAQQDYTTIQKVFKKDSGFWSDAVLGGFGFLAGTVATEFLRIGALKGLGNLAKIARGAKAVTPARKVITEAAKSTAKGSDVLKMLRNAPASQTNSAGSAVNTVLSVATSTAGESALEARMFREHAVEELKEQFKQINFREPTQSELYELEQMANNSGNSVFALNMATVGMSNAIMLGKMLGKGIKVGKFGKFGGDGIDVLNQAGKRIDRIKGRFALGRVAIEEGKAVVKLTKFQKALRAIGKGAIKPLSEGAEEGLQYAYETGAVDYLLSKTNLDALDNVSLLSSITNEGLAQTFGTQEGREQVLVGAILGFLGIPGVAPGSAVDMFRAGAGTDAFSKRLETLAANYNKYSETGLHANMASAVTQHEFNKRKMNAQDLMTMHDNKAAQTFGFFASRNALGLLDSEVDKIAEQIMAMDNETFAETYDKDIVLDNVDEVKKQLVTSLKDSATSFKEAHKIAKRINNNNYETQQDKDFVDGLAFVAYNIKDLDTREEQIVNRIKEIYPAFNQSAAKYTADLINEGAELEQRQQLTSKAQSIVNELTQLNEQIDTLKSQAQSLPDEQKAQVTTQITNLVNQSQELNKQVEEAKAQIKKIDEAIAQSQATATASKEARRQDTKLPDYNNEYDSFAEAITQSLQNYIDTQNAIEAKTDTNVEADELFQELVDLGRIAKKREALIAQYNYFTQSTGKENMLELKEKMLEALHERQKYDFVKHYLLDKMAKDNGLYDKADFDTALREAMALLKEMEDIGYETINEVQEHKIFALEDNNQVVYYSYVKYKDGTSQFYQVDERATVVKGGRVIDDIDNKLQKFIEENEDTTQIDNIRKVYNDSWVNGISSKLTAGLPVTTEELTSVIQLLNFLNIPGVQVEIIDNTVVFEIDNEITEYELVEANYENINKTITQLFSNYFDVQVAQDSINKFLPQFLNSEDDTAKFSDSVIQENIENTGFYNNSERMAAAKQHFENNKAILLQYLISNYTSKRITPEAMPAVIDNARRSIDNFNVPNYFNEQEAYQTDYFIALGQQLRGSEQFAEKTDEEVITESPEVLDKDNQPGTDTTENKPQGQTLDELTGVVNTNQQNSNPPSKSPGTQSTQDTPQNTESVKSYALRNILEVFTRSYTQEENKQASEVVRKVLRTKAANKDAYKPVFRVVVGDVKEGKLDLGDHYHKDKDGTKKSELKQQKGFVAKDRTVFLHLELQDPDTNKFVRIGQMLDPNRFKDAQGNDLDLTNADNIRRIYPDIDAQDIIPVSNGAVKMLNFTQSLTNYLNTEVANLEVGTPIPEDVFEDAANQAGVVIGAEQLREFVFPNDKDKNKLRETARKAPEQFSILRNYPPERFGFSVTNSFGETFDAIPYFKNGRLTYFFRVINGVLEVATVNEESKNRVKQAYQARESRNNESNNHILIVNSRLQLQTVDIVVPGKDAGELEDFNQKYTNILVDNGDFGASIEDLGLFTLSMNSALREKKNNQTIRLQTNDGIVEFVAAPDSDVASLNVKRSRNKTTNRNFVEFSVGRRIKSSGNLVNFTPIKYKFNYVGNKIEMSVNRNGKTVIISRYDTFNVEQVLKDINTDIQNNADYVMETLNTVENAKISKQGGGQTVYEEGTVSITNMDDVAIADVRSLSLRDATTKPKDYIVAMLRTDVAAEAVVDENGETVRLMPNNVYAEFGLTEPVDTNLANSGQRQTDITEEDTKEEYDSDNIPDIDVTEQPTGEVSKLEKPYKTLNDGSGRMVTVTTETTEKDGIKKTKFKTQTTNRAGEPRTQNDKGYNTFEEAVENLEIDLQSPENESALELVQAVKENQGKETVPTRVVEIRKSTDKSSPFYGLKVATVIVGGEKIDFTLKDTTDETVVTKPAIEGEQIVDLNDMFSSEDPAIMSMVTTGNESQIHQSLGVDIDTLLKNGDVKYTDETGTECAKAGMASAKFTAGSKWSLVKDLKNMPTHEQGGVNLTFGDGGFMIGTVKAEKGLVIKTDPPSDDTADLQTMKDAFEYTKKYYNSPKFKERYLNAYRKSYGNYNDIRGTDKEQDYLEDIKIEDIQFDNHFRRIQADINNNLKTGQYYLLQGNVEQPMSDRIKRIIKGRPVPSKEGIGSHLSKKRNIVFAYKDQVDHDGEKFGMKQIAPHEFSHQAVNYIESIPPNQKKEIEAMQKGRGGMHIDKVYETKADIDAVRYNMYKSGVYNPMEEDFTIEHLNKYKQTGDKTIKRLEKQYKTRDIIKLMNTVAFNDEDNYLPSYDPFGNTIKAQDGLVITDPPKTTQDSINFMADKIIQYEIARGSAQGTGLPKYKNPYYKDLLVNKIYPEVKKIMPNASAQEAAEAMDFIFNSGFDQTTFKIDKDPRGYALQEYYRKYDKSKLDSDGNWSGRKNPAYSFDDEYNNTIAKLPENERRILMNKGRDWYLQNIERSKGSINENLEAYKNTWYGRIWNTNDFRPFNPNDPRFIYKKK